MGVGQRMPLMQEENKHTLLFTYGTLSREGNEAYRFLNHVEEFVGVTQTTQEFSLWDDKGYSFAYRDWDCSLHGEVYVVSKALIRDMMWYFGRYQAEDVMTPLGYCKILVGPPHTQRRHRGNPVPGGDWSRRHERC